MFELSLEGECVTEGNAKTDTALDCLEIVENLWKTLWSVDVHISFLPFKVHSFMICRWS